MHKYLLKLFVLSLVLPISLLGASIFDKLPDNVLDCNNKLINTHSIIAGKNYIALYFVSLNNKNSKEFTSKLLNFYNTKGKEEKVEVIFISLDQSDKIMKNNIISNKIPWYFVAYNSIERRNLINSFDLRETPFLVIYDADGKIVTRQSAQRVYKSGPFVIDNIVNTTNKENLKSTTKNTTISQNKQEKSSVKEYTKNETENNSDSAILKILSDKLLLAKGKEVATDKVLKNKKYIALYFSALWCGPCRYFTPTLVDFYKKVSKKGSLEVIFVSRDRDENSMKQYINKANMPWVSIPFNAKERNQIAKNFKVNAIPTLIILDSNGKIISNNARFDVVKYKEKAIEQWQSADYKPTTYQDISQNSSKNKTKKSRKNKKNKK